MKNAIKKHTKGEPRPLVRELTVRGVPKTLAIAAPSKDGLPMPGVVLTKTGMTLPEELTEDEWQSIGTKLALCDGSIKWWLGDWLAHAERKWGKYDDAIRKLRLPWSKGSLQNMASVSRKVESSRRRENLPYAFHTEIAGLSGEKQSHWLDEAEKHKLSRAALRKSIIAGHVVHNTKHVQIETEGVFKARDIDDDAGLAIRCWLDKLPSFHGCDDLELLSKWHAALSPLGDVLAAIDARVKELAGKSTQPKRLKQGNTTKVHPNAADGVAAPVTVTDPIKGEGVGGRAAGDESHQAPPTATRDLSK